MITTINLCTRFVSIIISESNKTSPITKEEEDEYNHLIRNKDNQRIILDNIIIPINSTT